MRLAELQAAVHAALRHERSVGDVAAALGVPERRLTIYRDFVTGHVTRVLGKVYPYCKALTRDWDALALAFHRDVPARERELNACVAGFPEWLDGRVAMFGIPTFLPLLAQIEWELFAAWANENDVPDPSTLSEPLVNPTVSALSSAWAIVPWLVANPDPAAVTATTAPPEAREETALIFREARTHRSAYHVASDDLVFAVKVVSERITVADAAAIAGAPREAVEAAIARAIEIGLVLLPDFGDVPPR